jgi:hypothetical protein
LLSACQLQPFKNRFSCDVRNRTTWGRFDKVGKFCNLHNSYDCNVILQIQFKVLNKYIQKMGLTCQCKID